ncbi:MAG TPA: hypothetical protein VGM65_11665 [Candidatus Udaeobacter sp.]
MSKLFTPTTILCFAAFLAGCATPYGSSGFLGGYSDTALAPDVYRISFQGNGYTSQERTQDFAILRAADLTLSHGYRYFGIVDQTEGGRSAVINTPGQAYTYVSAQRYGNFVSGTAHTTYIPGATIPVFFPQSGLMIRCFNERPEGAFALDAGFVSRSLRDKYHVK